jgi:hypothetical protein
VSALEALVAQMQALRVQSGPWYPETRTRCLNAIRHMTKALRELEEMIRSHPKTD